MKNTYIHPTILIQRVTIQQMICASGGPEVIVNTKASVNSDNIESRRGSSLWDDEE